MQKRLAGHISLHLSLINTIHAGPDKCTADDDGPERVSPHRVGIKAETQSRRLTFCSISALYLPVFFIIHTIFCDILENI